MVPPDGLLGDRLPGEVSHDTGGGGLEDDTMGRCVRELGHRRVWFATDATMEGGVGKILSADLTPEQREDIFWRNLQKLLDRRPV